MTEQTFFDSSVPYTVADHAQEVAFDFPEFTPEEVQVCADARELHAKAIRELNAVLSRPHTVQRKMKAMDKVARLGSWSCDLEIMIAQKYGVS